MNLIFTFAGQGSQFYGMGRPLYESNTTFRNIVNEIDQQIEDILGLRIKDIMLGNLNDRAEIFDDIITSSLAIFTFEYAAAMMLLREGLRPDGVVGCSLGEFSAAAFSEVIDIKTAIQLIVDQTRLIQQNVQPGGMITICEDYHSIKNYVAKSGCSLVSINHSKHFVVSADKISIDDLLKYLKNEKITYFKLPVNYGFHSNCMEYIEDKYKNLVKDISFQSPKYAFYSCVYGKQVHHIDGNYLWNVLREPILWRDTIIKHSNNDTIIVDLSADAELASMMKYISPENMNVYKVSTTFNTKIDIKGLVEHIKSKGERKLKAIVFPGQGSQFEGMGKELFDEFPEYIEKANNILGYSIKDICLNNPNGLLNQTEYTQPALYIVCTLSYLKLMKENAKPDYVAGHSIGEYSALFAAGVVDFETGLRLVKKRGELMQRAEGGGMAAVVGLKEPQVRQVLKDSGFTAIDVANLNSPTQIVISGKKDDIYAAENVFKDVDGCFMYKVLNVSGAFHSRYMEPAREEFTQLLNSVTFKPMQIPIIANTTARIYDETKIASTLSKQLVSSVYWTDSVRYLMAKGVDEFVEVGPGNVLTKLVAKIKREAEPLDLSKEPDVVPTVQSQPEESTIVFGNSTLGNQEFQNEYNTKYSYMIGSMGHGISDEKLVISAGRNGLLSFFGTSGLSLQRVEEAIKLVQRELRRGEPYGFNITFSVSSSEIEESLIQMYLDYGVHTIEASSYTTITKQLVRYRIKGLRKNSDNTIEIPNRIIVKLSRTDMAESFMSPPPKRIVDALLRDGVITSEEAELSQQIPMSHDICVVTDTAGYTDSANMFATLPTIESIRDRICTHNQYAKSIRVGAAGGIGSPVSASCVFLMGADFIMTGSINQCTVEAATSDAVKDMLSTMNVQDTSYVRTIDKYNAYQQMQVLKKGTLFYVCAEKFYNLYHEVNSIDEIDSKTRELIESRYLKKSFEEVLQEIQSSDKYREMNASYITPKLQLEFVFNWYMEQSIKWAIEGNTNHQLNYGIMCSSALGAFNQWVKGTALEDWRNRTIVTITEKLMQETTTYIKGLNQKIEQY